MTTCLDCTKPALPGYSRCANCLRLDALRQKKYYRNHIEKIKRKSYLRGEANKKAGRCYCGRIKGEIDEGHIECFACRLKMKIPRGTPKKGALNAIIEAGSTGKL